MEEEEESIVAHGKKFVRTNNAPRETRLAFGKELSSLKFQNQDVLGLQEEKEDYKQDVATGGRDAMERSARLQRRSANSLENTLTEDSKTTADGEESDNLQKEDFVARNSRFADLEANATLREPSVHTRDQSTEKVSLPNVHGKELDSMEREDNVVDSLRLALERIVELEKSKQDLASLMDLQL